MRTLIFVITIAMLITTSQANDTKVNVNFSIGSMKHKNANDTTTSMSMEVSGHKKVLGNLLLGFGAESQLTSEINNTNNGVMLIDIFPSLSYELTSNLSINGTFGYTYGKTGSITFTGKSKSIGAEYYFSKSTGIGLRYKQYDIDYDTTTGDIPDTLTATTISFNQKF